MKDYMQSLNFSNDGAGGRLTFHISPQDQHCQEGRWRPSSRNDESVTLWVAKHVRGQGRGESTDFPKRR